MDATPPTEGSWTEVVAFLGAHASPAVEPLQMSNPALGLLGPAPGTYVMQR